MDGRNIAIEKAALKGIQRILIGLLQFCAFFVSGRFSLLELGKTLEKLRENLLEAWEKVLVSLW